MSVYFCYSLSCRFLGQILSSSDAIESLEKDLPNYQTLLIKAWFRCALHVPGNSQMLIEVTRYSDIHGSTTVDQSN